MNHMAIWWYTAGPYIRCNQLYCRTSAHSLKWRCDIGLCQRLTAKTLMMAAESDTETLVLSHIMTRLLCEEYLGVFTKLQKSTVSFAMSVCPSVRMSVHLSVCLSAWNSAPNGEIFMKFDILVIFENLYRKFNVFLTVHHELTIH